MRILTDSPAIYYQYEWFDSEIHPIKNGQHKITHTRLRYLGSDMGDFIERIPLRINEQLGGETNKVHLDIKL